MEFLTNPWVICIIVVSVVIGNIAALKYTANMKFGQNKPSQDLDKLNQLDKESHPEKKDAD